MYVAVSVRLGQQLAEEFIDRVKRGLFLIDGVKDDRILPVALRHALAEAGRQQAADRGRRDEVARRVADHLLIDRPARLQIRLRHVEVGNRAGPSRLGLRHVGARHLADIEAVPRLLQLLRQHFDVVLAQAHDGLVAHYIDVGGGGVSKVVCSMLRKVLTTGLHGRLGLAREVEVLQARKNGLGQRHVPTAGVACAGEKSSGRDGSGCGTNRGPCACETSLSTSSKAVLASAVMVGRKLEYAIATCSSVARSAARCALSAGLIR